MTNREWLNTLSDEEFIEWDKKDCREKFGRTTTYCNSRNVTVSEHCTLCGTMWLQALRHTTADEDFAEIGFELIHKEKEYFEYKHTWTGKRFAVWSKEIWFYSTEEGGGFSASNMKIIEPIADKKRKEVWGNIHESEVQDD